MGPRTWDLGSCARMNVVTQFPALRNYDRDLRFQAMFEGAAIGFAICQPDGRILESNPALCRMLGYSRQELATTHTREIYPELDPEFHPQNACEIFPGNHLSGNLFPGNLSPAEQRLGELMRGERESLEVEKHYRRKDGSELWGHLTLSVARDERRQPAFLIAMLMDETENNRMRELLREAEKMEVIGRLTAGIVHDFNNLLTGVLLYCDLLSAEFGNVELGRGRARGELSQYLEEVRMASEQGAALTHQLLAIARKLAPEIRPTPINEIVASTKNLLRRLLGERIELIIVLDSALDSALDLDAGLVLADPAQLRQIILNLVLNARDAMPHGGKIALITRAAEFPSQPPDELSFRSLDNFEPGAARRAVSLVVKDNGCGMDAETRARLFEPFFTTKKPGEGIGLGLATVQRIVGEWGGVIEVESEPGHGTSIEVFLPAIEPASDDIQRVKTDSS